MGVHVFLIPPHPIPLGCPSAPALSTLSHATNLDWRSVSHMIIYMFQCYSLKSSTHGFHVWGQWSRWGGGCLVFIWTGTIKQVCRVWAIAKSRTRVSEIKSISQYCKSPLSETTFPCLLPQSPKDCSIHLCLFCCLAYRVIATIFLNSIYMS